MGQYGTWRKHRRASGDIEKKSRSGENLKIMFLIPAHSKRIPYVRNGLDEHFLTDRRGDHSSQVHLFTNPCVLVVWLQI